MVVIVQKVWKGYICRKKIKFYSNLPKDVFDIVIAFIVKKSRFFIFIERLLLRRLVLFQWQSPRIQVSKKFRLINFISDHPQHFNKHIVRQTLCLCFRIKNNSSDNISILFANSCIEKIFDSNLSFVSNETERSNDDDRCRKYTNVGLRMVQV